MSIRVEVQRAVRKRTLPLKRDFVRWVGAALAGRQENAMLTIRIVPEDEGRDLNERWRGKSYATNVLSFCSSGLETYLPGYLGDLVICADVVDREAKAQGKDLHAHWAHLVVHGSLHLLGYDHQQEQEAEAMEAIETAALQTLGYSDPYLEYLSS